MPDLYVWIAWAIAALCLATVAVAMSGRRARRRLARRDPRFQATDEVFRDPGSGDLTRVHVDAATGERRYWKEG